MCRGWFLCCLPARWKPVASELASIRRLETGAGGPEAPPVFRRSFTGREAHGDARCSRTQCTPRTGADARPGPSRSFDLLRDGRARSEARSGGARAKRAVVKDCYLVDPASSHMLVSKIKPCMCKYELIQTVKLRMAH